MIQSTNLVSGSVTSPYVEKTELTFNVSQKRGIPQFSNVVASSYTFSKKSMIRAGNVFVRNLPSGIVWLYVLVVNKIASIFFINELLTSTAFWLAVISDPGLKNCTFYNITIDASKSCSQKISFSQQNVLWCSGRGKLCFAAARYTAQVYTFSSSKQWNMDATFRSLQKELLTRYYYHVVFRTLHLYTRYLLLWKDMQCNVYRWPPARLAQSILLVNPVKARLKSVRMTGEVGSQTWPYSAQCYAV